jgi:hypothetical protein
MAIVSPRKKPYVRRGPQTVTKKGGKTRSDKRNKADAWLDKHSFFRRKPFQIGPCNHPLYEVYSKHMYDSTSFRTEFASYLDSDFRLKLAGITRNARSTSKFVHPKRSHVMGKKRVQGSSHGLWQSEKVKNPNFFSKSCIENRRTNNRVYDQSEKGQVAKWLRSEWAKEKRQGMCGAFVLPNGVCNQDFCGGLMNTDLPELECRSVVGYATNVSGVYVWYSDQETEYGLRHESTRFLTDGHSPKGRAHHNAVLMWNPHGHDFEDNTCPYNKRFNQGLEPLTKQDCDDLGIESFLLVDGEMTKREGRKIKQMCQYEINHFPLGSRLHRTPGAGSGLDNDEEADVVARRAVGITFLPPHFFELHPDICVVASAH